MKRSRLQQWLAGVQRGLPGRGRPIRLAQLVFLSLPIWLFAGNVSVGSIVDYLQLRQFDDWWANQAETSNLFVRRAQVALNGPRAALAAQELDAEKRDAAIVRLEIPKDQWAALQRDKQGTWGVWVDAGLVRGDVPTPVRIRRRGDTSVHWTTEKMSFTLRTPGSDRFRGYRTLAFSVADVLPQYVALALAQEFDLLSPYTDVTPVFVNGNYYGLYQVTETIDDDFLQRHKRAAGVIYQGDAAERGDVYPGVPRGLFMNPYIWDISAGEIDGVPTDRAPLIAFIQDINDKTFAGHLRLMDRLDRDEIARFVALMLITGDPYHMDNLHNQFWYADPVSGKLHPIPWDLRLLDLSKPPIWVNEFLRAVLRDPYLVDAVLQHTLARLKAGVIEQAERTASGTHARFREHFEYDYLRAGNISDIGRPEDVTTPLRANAALLGKWAADARVAYQANRSGDYVILDMESRGYAGADLTALDATESPSLFAGAEVFADRNRNGELDDSDPVVRGSWQSHAGGSRFVLERPDAIMAGWDTRGKGIAPGAVHYRYFVRGARSAQAGVKPVVRNRVTGAAVSATPWGSRAARTPTLSWSPWQYPQPRGATTHWAGVVDLNRTLELGPRDTLVIAAGTTVRMQPEVSLIARGRVYANGTETSPIRFVSTNVARPWGAVALHGEASDSSQFRHVKFVNGGGGTVAGIRYGAPVNVYGARGVLLENVEVTDNLRSEDAVRVAYGGAILRHCHLARTNADAVAFEYADGAIEDCEFEAIGGDAIKLIGSGPRVMGNRIVSADGRGITVSDESRPLIFGNAITHTAVGVDVRGGAEPLVMGNGIRKNGIGVQLDQARGQGGWAKVVGNTMSENASDLEMDNTSRLTELPASENQQQAVWNSLLRMHGLTTVVRGNKAVAMAQTGNFNARSDGQEFKEDFTSLADGWLASGGVLRLEKRNAALSATLEKRRGGMRRVVDWKVSDGAVLLLELAGRDVDNVIVSVASDHGVTREPATLNATEGRYTFVVLRLPPGHYKELRIEANPMSTGWEIDPVTGFQELRRSRLELAGFNLISMQPTIARR